MCCSSAALTVKGGKFRLGCKWARRGVKRARQDNRHAGRQKYTLRLIERCSFGNVMPGDFTDIDGIARCIRRREDFAQPRVSSLRKRSIELVAAAQVLVWRLDEGPTAASRVRRRARSSGKAAAKRKAPIRSALLDRRSGGAAPTRPTAARGAATSSPRRRPEGLTSPASAVTDRGYDPACLSRPCIELAQRYGVKLAWMLAYGELHRKNDHLKVHALASSSSASPLARLCRSGSNLKLTTKPQSSTPEAEPAGTSDLKPYNRPILSSIRGCALPQDFASTEEP